MERDDANRVTSVRVPHLVLCGPSLTLSPWTTAENKLSPDEGYSLGDTHTASFGSSHSYSPLCGFIPHATSS